MQKVVILLGGNIGNVSQIFEKATILLSEKLGKVILQSSLYASSAWGFEHENDFLNQVIVFETTQTPHVVLAYCLETELELGRERKIGEGYQARTIDIDILYYDSEIINTDTLTIPHPHIQSRRFTLEPLVEIIPEFNHPIVKLSSTELLMKCNDKGAVTKVSL